MIKNPKKWGEISKISRDYCIWWGKKPNSMRLYLIGHDYKYAAEQMLLTLWPEERPEYPTGKPSGDRLELRLSRGALFRLVPCVIG